MDKIKVIIVDNEKLTAESYKVFTERVPGFEVVAVGYNGIDAIELYKSIDADCMFLDIRMPIMDGIEALGEIRKLDKDFPVFILTFSTSKTDMYKLNQNNPTGVFFKVDDNFNTFLDVVKFSLTNGIIYQNQKVLEIIEEYIKERDSLQLTEKELEVLKLIFDGMTSKEIGDHLFKSPRTIDRYREEILKKCKAHNFFEVLKVIKDLGIELEEVHA